MKEGLLGPKVENVAVAIVQDIIDQGEPMYYVYLLNLRDDIMEGVIINSVGYGELKADGEQIRTSTLRHTLEILLPEEGTYHGRCFWFIQRILGEFLGKRRHVR
jgi:hypothetical protein